MVKSTKSPVLISWCLMSLLIALATMDSGCTTTPTEVKPEAGSDLMSPADELKFGYYVDALVCSEFSPLKDETLTNQVAAIGNRLVASSLRPDVRFTFKILNTQTVNAFSGPGGFVYVTVGLLDRLESKSELAAVLGHEIGHCCARHSIQSWKTAQKISNALSVVDLAALLTGFPPVAGAGGDLIADIGQRAAYLASMIMYQGYSRGYEYQADELGLDEMHKAHYDPEAMVTVLNKFISLREEEGQGKGMIILASHPHPEDRIHHVQKLIMQFSPGS
jgi:beta-barrel assembly-enhancing protease